MLVLPGLANAAELAVVIDDVGYNKVRGERAINLPGPVTIAVLPFAPHTGSLVEYATLLGKDVIVHQPMEPHASPHAREETGTLKLAMRDRDFDATLNAALAAVPRHVGLSNHTGSLLTAHDAPMRRLMRTLSSRGLFFLDSRTTAETVALDVARELGVPSLRRDVFLDHERTAAAVHAAFEKVLERARRQGHAVLIGHPYDLSLDYLHDRLAELPADIELVRAADLAVRQTRFSRPIVLARPVTPASPHISPGR